MRIYSSTYELMSEMGRELNSYGQLVKPKTYQNKNIEGMEDFKTKEIICQQYCLTQLDDPIWLFVYTKSKLWADTEFAERVSGEEINPGEAWKNREEIWRQFLVEGLFDYTYAERMNQKVVYKAEYTTKLEAIIQLLKDDHDTRKAILDIYGCYYSEAGPTVTLNRDADCLDGHERIPCSMYYDFLIRENQRGEKVLHICYHQRSSDFVQHFGNDVYLAWRLMEYVAGKVGIRPGYLYHTIDSLHVYKKDWGHLNSTLSNMREAII